MKLSWKIAVPVACAVLICAAAVTWKIRNDRGLAEAARTCHINAEQGDPKAQYDLGHMYYHGLGVQQNFAEAARWYREAANQGDARAQSGIGYLYEFGEGVPQDSAEALRWYRKAADQGYAKAQDNLALMYSHGNEVQQNYAEALVWFRKAADQGYAKAEYNLGNMYFYGRGVPQDRAEADRWYHKAAVQGDAYAQRVLCLKGRIPSTFSKINLSTISFGCLMLLTGSVFPGRRVKRRNDRAVALTALLGLISVALSLYWIYGSFPSILAVSAFFFAKNLLVGTVIVMFLTFVLPEHTKRRIAKIGLGLSAMLFVGFNIIAIMRYDLSRFPPAIRLFCMFNGMLLGILSTLAIFLWRTSKNSKDGQSLNSGVASFEPPAECEAVSNHL
jgi:hypothetical protein